MSASRKTYPPHLWTLEWDLGPRLPVLFHHYPTEDSARLDFRTARGVMSTSPQAIHGIALYHRHSLQASAVPTPQPTRVFPKPDPDGVIRLPAVARELRPSSRYFNSADLVVVEAADLDRLPI